ncbi:MAG TPA: Gfo/Idh/MocA family oxidoreductase [Candidatus Limnocylindrales bacterium]|nr:Gfo/Idh/MocA family oxidoreductase [Candidatus Limnocylindrales bacterium]
MEGPRDDPSGGEPVRLGLIGAGQRGAEVYGAFALARPDLARFVAVAEPDPARRSAFAAAHGIAPSAAHPDAGALLASSPRVEAVVIATPDRAHVPPAVAALEAGYPVLLEKPIAPDPAALAEIHAAAARTGGELTIAHPLRYTAFFARIAGLLADGAIGDLVEIDHLENVGWWHFAHSYVRGNWRRSELASPIILAKACHDLDVIRWLAGAACTRVASSGSLKHFRPEEAPPGSPAYCLDGCPVADDCPFYAPRFYHARLAAGGWPVSVVTPVATPEALDEALRSGPYGRCVYHSDNDVADHQATLLEFANGVVATLTVTAFTAENTRTVKLMGTRGEIRGHMERGEIELRRFRESPGVDVPPADRHDVGTGPGHAGGDAAMIEAFLRRVVSSRGGGRPGESPTSLAVSLESHRMAFAAERARLTHSVVSP